MGGQSQLRLRYLTTPIFALPLMTSLYHILENCLLVETPTPSTHRSKSAGELMIDSQSSGTNVRSIGKKQVVGSPISYTLT